jgi:putative tricarboxylic transport membrane protein
VRTVNIVAGAFFIALSVFAVLEGRGLQFYAEGVPGPGFFPTVLAIVLAFSGALLIVLSVVKPAEAFPEFERPSRSQAQRSLGVWVALLGAAIALNILGFFIAMFLFVAVLLLVIERRGGVGTIVTIVLTPLLAYLLFGTLLQVRLPTGLFGG